MNFASNPLQIAAEVLSYFRLETPTRAAFVTGGLLHRLLRVETGSQTSSQAEKQVWALKLLSPRLTCDEAARSRLETGETLAALAWEAGIPVAVAQKGPDGARLQFCAGSWVSLCPWIEGETLPPSAASPANCRTMGRYLGQLHALKVRFPGQSEPAPEAFESGHWRGLIERASDQNLAWAAPFVSAINELENINARAMSSQLELREGWVTGHLDFDQKNVLWRGPNPTILDWESAKPIHPALEAMGAGLSWAGQSAGSPNFDSFRAFFGGYADAHPLQPDDLERAVEAVLGKWIIWLEFNLQRLLDGQIQGTGEAQIALDAARHALGATLQLSADGPMYRSWLRGENRDFLHRRLGDENR